MTDDIELRAFDDAGVLTYEVLYKSNHVGDVFEDMGFWWYRTPYALMSWRTTDCDSAVGELLKIKGIIIK